MCVCERDFALRIGLFQRLFEADRCFSNVNRSGEVKIEKVKDEKGKCKHYNGILQS